MRMQPASHRALPLLAAALLLAACGSGGGGGGGGGASTGAGSPVPHGIAGTEASKSSAHHGNPSVSASRKHHAGGSSSARTTAASSSAPGGGGGGGGSGGGGSDGDGGAGGGGGGATSSAPSGSSCATSTSPGAVITVCPGRSLADGTQLTITGHRFKPNENLLYMQCDYKGENANNYGLSDCNINGLKLQANGTKSDANGDVGPLHLTVRKTFKSIDCSHVQCMVTVAVPLQSSTADNPHALIYFS